MATISQQRGKWKCQVRKSGYPARSKVFETKEQAVQWGAGIEADMDKGVFEEIPWEPAPKTVKALLEKYLQEESPKKRSGRSDVLRIKRLQGILGSYAVENLTSRRISQYKADRLATGAAAQTVLHDLALLHRAYVLGLQEWGVVLPGGIPRTSCPKLPEGRDNRIPKDLMSKIISASGSSSLGVVMEFAVETCMRRSEIALIQWEHVSIESRTVRVPITKNGQVRTVPLSTRAVDLLKGRGERESGLVFTMEPDSITRAFSRAVKKAELDYLRFHDLRHEGISRLFEKGLNVIEVSRISGHKTLSQLNRYTHLDVSHLLAKLG